ncbi:(Fe-S)-cluster assembly protein [Longimycelium tulufanense]|uniref:(Fe-S)-cluster assembly protein n=2 Tax=Longimycelium tulufanense TaxID=907463 RepID=A0A8J3FUG3_9PSEU|nr:(Fe-S)-cluster assembly protein [Longimycelium tulufanense]
MERAFAAPKLLADRIGGLDAHRIAAMNPDEFAAACAGPPAIHRFPGSMARRLQALSEYLVERYDGRVEALWSDGDPDGVEVLRRLKDLPGFGDQKARIFLALLGKQMDVQPEGWRGAAGPYGEDGARRSAADVVDDRTLQEVRAFKKQMRTAAKKS